ncbi:MAG: AAA family ATPase, partial [Muribaculaceae bacterium]|nr:AAA family ATPase [Muribaculaceae bacterium]
NNKRKRKDRLDDLVGLDEAKERVREHVATIKAIVKQRGRDILNSLNTNILITGPSGAGVTSFYYKTGDYLTDEDIVDNDKCDVFNPLTIDTLDLSENPLECIMIDEVQKLLPDDIESDLVDSPLAYAVKHAKMAKNSKDRRLALILAGDSKLQEYVDAHPDLKNLFALNIKLQDYTPAEVADICEYMLDDTYKLGLTEDAHAKLCRVFAHDRRNSERFGNAHLAASMANDLMMAATRRVKGNDVKTVIADDVTGEEYVPKTLDEVMQEFDRYVGVDEIKETMTGIVNSIRSFQKLHPDTQFQLKDHYLFLGNPGTGKTTMARVFADALSAMGILPTGQLVEVAPKDLKGQYMGHTGPKVDAVFDRAMGGVLFIDEAYDMWGGEDDTFGNEAVTALIKNVEDRRGKLVVILAGYPREMGIFATANPGITSRFNTTIDFRDYKPEELTEIARRMIKAQGYTLDADAEKMIGKFFECMYVSRKKDFANAREVRNAVDKAIKNQNTRVQKEMGTPGFNPAAEFVLTMADFTGSRDKQPMTVDEVIATMDDLIGMADIKEEIRKLANVAMVNRMRMERGLGASALQPVNIILTGNPGTGKTTIAKRLGQVLHAAGVLSTDKVVEREAKTILSSYVNASGQTMDKAV